MKQYFAENLRKYRTVRNISQTELAQKLGVSGQAVSKWECALSYPDIEMLTEIADLFEIPVDILLRENADGSDHMHENACCGMELAQLPDDNVVRVVQCIGRRIVKTEEDPEKRMLLAVDSAAMEAFAKTCNITIHFDGRTDIKGNLHGADITASNGICCNGICCGNVYADGDIVVSGGVCSGNINSEGSLTISGGVNSGNINSEDAVSVSGDMNCGDVEAESVNCESLAADKVSCQILKCEGNLTIAGSLQKKQE